MTEWCDINCRCEGDDSDGYEKKSWFLITRQNGSLFSRNNGKSSIIAMKELFKGIQFLFRIPKKLFSWKSALLYCQIPLRPNSTKRLKRHLPRANNDLTTNLQKNTFLVCFWRQLYLHGDLNAERGRHPQDGHQGRVAGEREVDAGEGGGRQGAVGAQRREGGGGGHGGEGEEACGGIPVYHVIGIQCKWFKCSSSAASSLDPCSKDSYSSPFFEIRVRVELRGLEYEPSGFCIWTRHFSFLLVKSDSKCLF